MNRVMLTILLAWAFLILDASYSLAEPQPTDANKTQVQTIRAALTQVDRDLEDFHTGRAALLTNLPAHTEPGAPSVDMVRLVMDGRKTLEVESNLVQLVKDYSAKCRSHLPQTPDLAPQIKKYAESDDALKVYGKTLLALEHDELDVLTQMLTAYNARDVKAWNALNGKYGALQNKSKELMKEGKDLAAMQEKILAEARSKLEETLKTLHADASGQGTPPKS